MNEKKERDIYYNYDQMQIKYKKLKLKIILYIQMERWLDSLFKLILKLIINFSLYIYLSVVLCCVVFAVVNCNKETYKYIFGLSLNIENEKYRQILCKLLSLNSKIKRIYIRKKKTFSHLIKNLYSI